MLAKGFALVKTRRTSSEGLGEIIATLEDGIDGRLRRVQRHGALHHGFRVGRAERDRASAWASAPARTYLYGHSAGARIGRGMNYTPGLNVDRDGKPFFDGFLADDGAAGGWLPVLMKDGKDVLLATDADKAAFVPQLDIVAPDVQQHLAIRRSPTACQRAISRTSAATRASCARRGSPRSTGCTRSASISHSGGENLPDGRRGEVQILDMSKLMDRFIDMLDAWVDKGTAPPPRVPTGPSSATPTRRHDRAAGARLARSRVPARRLPPVSRTASRARRRLRRSRARGSSRSTAKGVRRHESQRRLGLARNARRRPGGVWVCYGADETLTRERYATCVATPRAGSSATGFFGSEWRVVCRASQEG